MYLGRRIREKLSRELRLCPYLQKPSCSRHSNCYLILRALRQPYSMPMNMASFTWTSSQPTSYWMGRSSVVGRLWRLRALRRIYARFIAWLCRNTSLHGTRTMVGTTTCGQRSVRTGSDLLSIAHRPCTIHRQPVFDHAWAYFNATTITASISTTYPFGG